MPEAGFPVTDHPRIRGEHTTVYERTIEVEGSSPHTRGAPGAESRRRLLGGIIPAYAGSTRRAAARRHARGDHPRIRGEHRPSEGHVQGHGGSSPHTRGALHADAERGEGLLDHPRIRGEHRPGSLQRRGFGGSSPHTRGALTERRNIGVGRGIIPAYAGSTRRSRAGRPRKSDHPRIRGEHPENVGAPTWRTGSSPHTRGAPDARRRRHPRWGIIPAYAGSTLNPDLMPSQRPDHPRIRGEHRKRRSDGGVLRGSSPHTRGALTVVGFEREVPRIIPAYAGSTSATSSSTPRRLDHPRIRGEHRMLSPGGVFSAGSSPHTRGARSWLWRRARSGRIIPAYAGSTCATRCCWGP